MLHFKESHIDYNGVRADGTYAPQTENRVYFSKWIEPAALTNSTLYRITSRDDPAYSVERPPVAFGYKAKGTEFNGPDKQPPYLREYGVFAVLPAPMQSGKAYTVHVGDLAVTRPVSVQSTMSMLRNCCGPRRWRNLFHETIRAR